MTSLALFCAVEGFPKPYAARAIGCHQDYLDALIDAFHVSVTTERRRRQGRQDR